MLIERYNFHLNVECRESRQICSRDKKNIQNLRISESFFFFFLFLFLRFKYWNKTRRVFALFFFSKDDKKMLVFFFCLFVIDFNYLSKVLDFILNTKREEICQKFEIIIKVNG